MAIPPSQKQIVDLILAKYCAEKVPIHARDRVNMGYRVEGNAVVLFEQRRIWNDKSKWRMCDVAKFRYAVGEGKWHLYWRNRNLKWKRYDCVEPSTRFQRMLDEVDRDPTALFWG